MGKKELIEIVEKRENIKLHQEKKESYEKPTGIKKKYENFFYHYKWIVVSSAILICIVSVFIYDILNRVDYDLSIVMAGSIYIDDVTYETLVNNIEQITSDVNKDGEVNVSISNITISSLDDPASAEMEMAGHIKLTGELSSQSSYIYILDKNVYDSVFKSENAFAQIEYMGEYVEIIPLDHNPIFKDTPLESNDLYIAILDKSIVNFSSDKKTDHYNASRETFSNIIMNGKNPASLIDTP